MFITKTEKSLKAKENKKKLVKRKTAQILFSVIRLTILTYFIC